MKKFYEYIGNYYENHCEKVNIIPKLGYGVENLLPFICIFCGQSKANINTVCGCEDSVELEKIEKDKYCSQNVKNFVDSHRNYWVLRTGRYTRHIFDDLQMVNSFNEEKKLRHDHLEQVIKEREERDKIIKEENQIKQERISNIGETFIPELYATLVSLKKKEVLSNLIIISKYVSIEELQIYYRERFW